MERGEQGQLASYLEWADRLTLAAAAAAPSALWERAVPASHGSLAGTLEHLFAAEWVWLERVSGRSPEKLVPAGGARTPDRLAALWPEVWEGWRRAAAERPAAAPVAYRTTGGAPHVTPFGEILLHVSHHSAAYRGQAAAALRALGLPPAATDFIAFRRG